VLFIVNAFLPVIQFVSYPAFLFPEFILVGMNSVLVVIFFNKQYFEKEDRYRLVGDAIFLLPLLYILT